MDYAVLKFVHVACVALNIALFALRGVWLIADSPRLAQRWVRIAPHVNDTLLLAAAIALAVLSRQYPFAEGWLTAKVLGLVAYIGIGTVAMRPGRSKRVRLAAWAAGLGVLTYIVGVAVTRNPRIFF